MGRRRGKVLLLSVARAVCSSYIRALYELIDNCDFGHSKNENIRDRLVVGVRDKELSKKMQLMPDLTLEMAIQMVRQAEDVEEQISRQLQQALLNVQEVAYGEAVVKRRETAQCGDGSCGASSLY